MKSTRNPACNAEEQSTSKNQDNKLKGKLRPIPIRMKKVNQGTSTVGDEQMPKKKLQVCSYHMLPLFSLNFTPLQLVSHVCRGCYLVVLFCWCVHFFKLLVFTLVFNAACHAHTHVAATLL